ncbi:SRPBCC domain-containing protein [Cryobacterium algoritolerans]|nr:SRPBCC domain-containing protein [Cryobacterium algoritolerans]
MTPWHGYITGRTLALDLGRRIVQSWRTTEFADDDPDSEIEVLFEAVDEGTCVTILLSHVPAGQRWYEESGWGDSYFVPMREYFTALRHRTRGGRSGSEVGNLDRGSGRRLTSPPAPIGKAHVR